MSKKTSKSFLILLLILLLIFSITLIILLAFGAFDFYKDGMAYFCKNTKKYEYRYEVINESISFSIDLTDLESNMGKKIYTDGNTCIEINQVSLDHEGNYRVYFRSHGTYSRKGGTLISGIRHKPNPDGTYTTNCQSKLQIKFGNDLFDCKVAGMTGLNYKDGDIFGYLIFSEGFFEENDINDAKKPDKLDLVLSELIKNEWARK